MNMPGFTSEASLHKMEKPYMADVFDPQADREYVQPAVRNDCEILYGLLLRARSDEARQYFYGAMLGAGCFR